MASRIECEEAVAEYGRLAIAANDSWHMRNACEHAECLADPRGVFDIEATREGIRQLTPSYPQAGSSVSHGTMRNEDLLCAFANELETCVDLRGNIVNSMFDAAALVVEARGLVAQYCDDTDGVDEETASDVVNAMFDALDCYAPEGCYFGAHEGDGSDYGYWPAE